MTSQASQVSQPWIILGAGLAGLTAALEIEKKGHSCLILEQSSEIGGKLQTEIFEGCYRLDHGFQVLLPSYPELKATIDLSELNLKYFEAGAIIHTAEHVLKIGDPLRNPGLLFETLFSKVGSLKDKALVMKLRLSVLRQSEERIFQRPLGSSLDFLRSFGFSEAMIDNFWRPFFSGVFLENELATEATFLKFLYKMFSLSPVAVPSLGIAQLPQKMAAKLRQTEVKLNSRVEKVEPHRVVLSSGEVFRGRIVDARPTESKMWGTVTTLYFAAEKSPVQGPWLVLPRKHKKSRINHLAVMSEVSSDYATKGDALISVNILQPMLGSSDLAKVQDELLDLFGAQARSWRFLKHFEIPQALPLYLTLPQGPERFFTPSQHGAIKRGKQLVLDFNKLNKN